MTEIQMIIIIIGAVIGALIAGKKKKSVILGLILGGVSATILVEVIWGVLKGLGYLH